MTDFESFHDPVERCLFVQHVDEGRRRALQEPSGTVRHCSLYHLPRKHACALSGEERIHEGSGQLRSAAIPGSALRARIELQMHDLPYGDAKFRNPPRKPAAQCAKPCEIAIQQRIRSGRSGNASAFFMSQWGAMRPIIIKIESI